MTSHVHRNHNAMRGMLNITRTTFEKKTHQNDVLLQLIQDYMFYFLKRNMFFSLSTEITEKMPDIQRLDIK